MKRVIAFGYFDSLHIGHIELLNETKNLAAELSASPAVMTFDDVFLTIVKKGVKAVYTLSERRDLLKIFGIDDVLVPNTDAGFFNLDKDEFLRGFITKEVAGAVCGEDYRFGKDGKGTAVDLKKYCEKKKIPLVIAPTISLNGEKVSSTAIRAALAEGDIPLVKRMLGRSYSITETVKRGRGKGGKMGIPTANVQIPPFKLCPQYGVYKTITEVSGSVYKSVTNVGLQPTFNGNIPAIETLMPDYRGGTLYGDKIKVIFVKKLRDTVKFSDINGLKAQIAKDIKEAFHD